MKLHRYWNPQLLGILCARGEEGGNAIDKFILIGDHKQLPAVVLQSSEQSAIYEESLMSIGLTNLKDSLFERLYRNCTARQSPLTSHPSYDMLCRQGRMHPEVALFANRAFYGGRLIPVGLPHQLEDPILFVVWLFILPYRRRQEHLRK